MRNLGARGDFFTCKSENSKGDEVASASREFIWLGNDVLLNLNAMLFVMGIGRAKRGFSFQNEVSIRRTENSYGRNEVLNPFRGLLRWARVVYTVQQNLGGQARLPPFEIAAFCAANALSVRKVIFEAFFGRRQNPFPEKKKH